MVSLKSQAERDLSEFEQHMADIPEIRECHMLNGEIDFILKIVATDLKAFQEILTTHLTPAPNVASVKTSLTIRTSKLKPGIPEFGRAHVLTPVTNAQLVCRLLLEKKTTQTFPQHITHPLSPITRTNTINI